MAQVHTYDSHTKTVIRSADDIASIVFTTNRGDKLYLEVNPTDDTISLFEADENDECKPDCLIKQFDIEHLENPSLDNDE
jgi:hypothetical protein